MAGGILKDIVAAAAKIDGWMEPIELEWLATAAASRRMIVEIGSWKGRSTKALAMATLGVVYAVDHWQGSATERASVHEEAAKIGPDEFFKIFKSHLAGELADGRVVAVRMESGEAVDMLLKLIGCSADMVFIDAEHTYESVSRDIKNYDKLLGSGGLLCGHDYQPAFQGVCRAVDELVPNRQVMKSGSIWHAVKP